MQPRVRIAAVTAGVLDRFAPRRSRVALARAFAGAILFALPLLMTMEMWSLGATMERSRLVLLVLVNVPLLVALSHYIGFESTHRLRDDVVDAFVAWAVAFVAAALALAVFGEIDGSMSVNEIAGKLVLQAVPASVGAALASGELGGADEDEEDGQRDPTYLADVFYMITGALFLAFNLAPTEEIVLIAHKVGSGNLVALALVSLALMHAFVYAVGFRGQHGRPEDTGIGAVFLRYTVVGYALALLVSLYVLWTFGRLDGIDLAEATSMVVVLAFPAALGAAAARLIL